MRRRSRRATRPARTYTIGYLLSRQPKGLRKIENYEAMVRQFRGSPRLHDLHVSRRCYTLLNNARIEPHNLRHFYRTYRLPADPFFPLFFAVKHRYLADRERAAEERRRSIIATLRALPPPILAWIKYLGHLERYYNPAGRSPVWQQRLFPRSRKQADGYARRDRAAWAATFRGHLLLLSARYAGITSGAATRIAACFLLELPPGTIPPTRPEPDAVNRAYRRRSLLHHPDRGGDPKAFIELKRARDALLAGR